MALAAQMPAVVAVLMGVVTAVFGGVLRDIVCNEVPRAFSDHRPYALCAFVGAWVTVGAATLAWPGESALLAGAAAAIALRAAALWTDFRLPAWRAWAGGDDR